MHNVREITKDLYSIGGDDRKLSRFENIHPIPEGISYNSYLLVDEKTVLLDTVDLSISDNFIENVQEVLGERPLDYLVINHMEPDHAGSIGFIQEYYPDVKVIGTKKTFDLLDQFNFKTSEDNIVVKDGDTMSFGEHELMFISAPMVHWPETMATFDTSNGVLFTADAFGTFKSLDGKLFNDEVDFESDFLVPARRYYSNIVGKYGPQVQSLMKKASKLDVKYIAPLHGPVWRTDLEYILDKYDKWSKYEAEEQGVLIVYGSMYGNTEKAAEDLAKRLIQKGMTNIKMYDASKTHVSYLVSDAFKYSHIVLASATYNLNIYTPVQNFLLDIKSLNLRNRTVGIVGNGSWAPTAEKLMKEILGKMKDMDVLEESFTITSTMKEEDVPKMEALADSIIETLE
ncbi:MAG: FprA family A-type flavoprotein [Tissierella sp.]|uniref:FprA family A-type flavoprotein n=1 Tax=Tissierella sp. TaxID=41274 RepID=UPI003F976FB1